MSSRTAAPGRCWGEVAWRRALEQDGHPPRKPIRRKDPSVTHFATCDVPVETLDLLTSLLHRHRRAHDTRPHQRAGTTRNQAKLVLQWFRAGHQGGGPEPWLPSIPGHGLPVPARGHQRAGLPKAPELHEALPQTGQPPYLMLDGTLISTDRTEAG